MVGEGETLWQPPHDARTSTVMGQFWTRVEAKFQREFADYDALWQWSITETSDFWGAVAEYFEVTFHDAPTNILSGDEMPDTKWFEGGTLNYAQQLLSRLSADSQIIAMSDTRERIEMSGVDLRTQVAAVAHGLRERGLGEGDRVAAYMPNIPETIIAFLAAASIGATWSLVPPEFGSRAAIARLEQFHPDVLFTVDGYRYGERVFDKRPEVSEIRSGLKELKLTVSVPYLYDEVLEGATSWTEIASVEADEDYAFVSFDHPLYVLYSSGTTGPPKAIVHGHGGMVIDHLKQMRLQDDLGPGDRFYWHASTGWMVWNLGVSALMCGASLVIFDGDPFRPALADYWQRIGREKITYLGLSAAFIMQCRTEGIVPKEVADLSHLRTVISGGSRLTEDGWRWVYENVNDRVYLASNAGGTELAGVVIGGTRVLPVHAGEMTCRYLGAAVFSFDDEGQPVYDQQGEMVITKPGPFMPLGLLDQHGTTVKNLGYFKRYPGVWSQGDWLTISTNGFCLISGRLDATLNRGGVRLGTGEFYPVVENVPGVADSLVIHLEDSTGGAGELILFVQLEGNLVLDDALIKDINRVLAKELSPRHVPDHIYQVSGVPRSLNGKKLEVPVKRILRGAAISEVVDSSATSTFELLQEYERYKPVST